MPQEELVHLSLADCSQEPYSDAIIDARSPDGPFDASVAGGPIRAAVEGGRVRGPATGGRVRAAVAAWEQLRSPGSSSGRLGAAPSRAAAPRARRWSRRRLPRLPADCFTYALRFLAIHDRPVINRAALTTYVALKNRRLGNIPVLVDVWWHGTTCLGRYCVCRAANLAERLEEYQRGVCGPCDVA